MIKKSMLLAIVFLFLAVPNLSFALRCGSNLVNVGDLKHEVMLACGSPFSKEVIGFIDQEKDGDRITVMKIEEWIVEQDQRFYSLVFEGNKLIRIEAAGEKQ